MDFLTKVDVDLLLLINHYQNKILDFLSLGISWITEGGLIWILACFFIFLFDKADYKRKIIIILAALILNSWIVNVPFKLLFICRKRPFQVIEGINIRGKVWENCAFPSGHVASSTTALLMFFYFYPKIRKPWIFSLVTLFLLFLGFSRIYVGMHYPSDVVGGLIVGLISAFIMIWFERKVKFNFN